MQIDFEGVTFAYKGKPNVLQDINLHVPSGTSLGLIGPSGCGKTTLAQMVPRFYDPVAGCVRIDGKPLSEYASTHQLRRRIGFVPQGVFIKDGTLRDNLIFGNPQPDNHLTDMIDRVRPELWVTLNHGLDTKLGDGGIRISGGERLCIAIIRELLKPVEFILFDEATSGLDAEGQQVAQAAIDATLKQNVTTIVIAHRLIATQACDSFCVINQLANCEGREQIEAKGNSHPELWERSETFRRNAALEGISF